jgi:hypothetical protein
MKMSPMGIGPRRLISIELLPLPLLLLVLVGSLVVWRAQIVKYGTGQTVCGWIGGKWGSAQGVA